MISFQREKLQDILPEFKELLEFNYKQTASNQDRFPMELHWDSFINAENNNAFFMTTVRDDARLIGYMSFIAGPNLNFIYSKTAWMDKYVVRKEYWGKGLGKELLSRTTEWAKELGCQRIFGGVRLNQGEAPQKMYKNEGFEPVELNFEKVLI